MGSSSSCCSDPKMNETADAVEGGPVMASYNIKVGGEENGLVPTSASNGDDSMTTSMSTKESTMAGSFSVTLTRGTAGEGLGMDLDFLDGKTAYVCNVLPDGLVAAWNRKAAANLRVKVGDYIYEVNESRGVRTMQDFIRSGTQLNIGLARPLTFKVSVHKDDELGVELDTTETSNNIIVTKILQKGALSAWNKTSPSSAVQRHDRIIEVNGRRGSGQSLFDALKHAKQLELVVSRYQTVPIAAQSESKMPTASPPSLSLSTTATSGGDLTKGMAPPGQEEEATTVGTATGEGANQEITEPTVEQEVQEDGANKVIDEPATEQETNNQDEEGAQQEVAEPTAINNEEPVTEAAAAGAGITMNVQVPAGVAPGQLIQVAAPDGRQVQVQVPSGVTAGQVIQIQVPPA